jgi:hypothetical protein
MYVVLANPRCEESIWGGVGAQEMGRLDAQLSTNLFEYEAGVSSAACSRTGMVFDSAVNLLLTI